MLRISLACLIASVTVLLLPFLLAKIVAAVFGLFFLVFLVLGLTITDDLPA